jgi:DNA-binding IclR family transcriptional regulator
MAFPIDPNAPGGPRRSEYVRRGFARAGAPADAHADDTEVTVHLVTPDEHEPVVVAEVDGQPVAAVGLRDGEVVADPAFRTSGILALLHLRRLEARIIMSIFGA